MMNSKNHKVKLVSVVGILSTLIISIILATLSSLSAAATTDATELLKKSLALGISKCVNKTYMQPGPVKESDFKNMGIGLIMTSKGKQDQVVYIPTKVGNTLETAKVTCQELFQGTKRSGKKGHADGLMQLYNKQNPSLTDFSYEVGDSSSGDKRGCIAVKYFASDGSKKTTNKVCFKLDSDNRIVFKSNSDLEVNKLSTPIGLSFFLNTQELGIENAENTRVSFSALAQAKDGTNWDTLVKNTDNALKSQDNPIYHAYNNNGDRLGLSYDSLSDNITSNSTDFSDYTFTSNQGVVLKAFTGKSTFSEVKFSEQEEYDLLESYYKRYASGSEKVLATGDCFSDKNQAKQKSNSGYAHYENGKWCAVLNSEQVPSDLKFNVVNAANNGLTPTDFKGVLKKLTDWNFNSGDGSTGDNAGVNDAGNNEDGGDNIESPCTVKGGALSWILCPVLTIVGDVVKGLYGWIENQFLTVNSNLYGSDSGTYAAWQQFQGYANIFFIILLVLVIISQVTGFGISNYGIKKTLPKLIIAIILINISFFVCQIAVDLSNIIGSSLKDIFDSASRAFTGEGGAGEVVGTIVTYVVGVGEVAAAGAAIGAIALNSVDWGVWMVPLIITLIGCLLGVIFFFIILCVRQAAVVVLIILAPLAIAAYSLPNTKKLFDRWFKLFSAMLMVYPICGLLVGGGGFVSKLMIENAEDGNAGIGLILVGLLANIIPFFLIPGILRSSMSAMGNLGAKISGFGDRLSRGIGRTFRGSELAKDIQRRSTMRNTDYLKNRIDRKYGGKSRENMKGFERWRYDRAHRRFTKAEAANRRLLEEEAAIQANDGRHMALGDEDYNRLVSGKQMAQLDQDIKNQQAAYEVSDKYDTGDAGQMGQEFQTAMTAFLDDPSDYQNGIRMRALQNILVKTDAGRAQLRNAYYGARAAGKSDGLEVAARHLKDNYGDLIKSKDRGFFAALGDFSQKDFSKAPDSFIQKDIIDKEGNVAGHYYASNYDLAGAGSWSPETLSGADSSALRGIEDGVIDKKLRGKDKDNFVNNSINALGNERLSATKPDDAGTMSRIVARAATGGQIASMNAKAMRTMVNELNEKGNDDLRQKFVQRAKAALADGNNHFDANALNELRRMKGISAADIARATNRNTGRFEGGGHIDHDRNSSRNFSGGRIASNEGFYYNAPSGTVNGAGIYIPNSSQPHQDSQGDNNSNNNNSGQ